MGLSQCQVLVVEDDDLLRECIVELFEMSGAQVNGAENGASALKLLVSGQYDILISDLRMPGMDGLEMIKRLRALAVKQPIVFICTGTSEFSLDEVNALKVIEVFRKPFEGARMIASVAAAVNRSEKGDKTG